MDVQGALGQALPALENAGVDEAWLDAELLLAHTLGVNRAVILAHPCRELTPKELTRYRALIARRAAREPLAYLVGRREFFGLDFRVDARVLIPRPETEVLVEWALEVAHALPGGLVLADVGAGSGAIAVTLAVHLPGATVYALDQSLPALAVVEANARQHGVATRIRCLQGDLLAPLPERVDLITANLPYVATHEWEQLPPEIREYEPREALDGGPDGLNAIRRLLAEAGAYLRPGGAVLLEIGATQGTAVTALARQSFPQAQVHLRQDYAGRDRVVMIQI